MIQILILLIQQERSVITHMHRPHSGGVGGTGESQVDFGDVLAGSYNRTVLPAEALLGAAGHVQGVDGENQGLRA